MSITLVLIPIALAVAAHRAARQQAEEAGHHLVSMKTRMRDRELLARALADLGCETSASAYGLVAVHAGGPITFTEDEAGVLQAHFEGDVDVAAAEHFLLELDDEYARLVQEQVYQRLVERAKENGMEIESERVDDDNAIVVTLLVQS